MCVHNNVGGQEPQRGKWVKTRWERQKGAGGVTVMSTGGTICRQWRLNKLHKLNINVSFVDAVIIIQKWIEYLTPIASKKGKKLLNIWANYEPKKNHFSYLMFTNVHTWLCIFKNSLLLSFVLSCVTSGRSVERTAVSLGSHRSSLFTTIWIWLQTLPSAIWVQWYHVAFSICFYF